MPSVLPLFSPEGGIADQVVWWIEKAQDSVELAGYSFTNWKIADALSDAPKRGVTVSVLLDRSQTHGKQAAIHDLLEKAGVHIRLVSPKGGIMHNKFLIVDGQLLEWGSYNYTNKAEHANFENATFARDPELALQYYRAFMQIYSSATFEVYGAKRPIWRFLRRIRSWFMTKF